MKHTILIFILSFSLLKLSAQDNVGIGTLTPNANALLDLETSNKGLLIPRLSTAQRLAIAGLGATEKALLVFDTDLNTFFYWDATQWVGFPLDNDASNELQNLVLQNDSILINNGAGIDVSGLLDNTDNQNLSFSNDTLYIENGNWIYAPDNVNDADFDATNELQLLSFDTDSVYLSNGNAIALTNLQDGTGTDDQILSLSNDTLYLENGGYVVLVDNVNDADFDSTNEIQDLTLQNDSVLISGGNGIDISGLSGGTDDQNLTSATLSAANILTINIENGNATTVDLSSLDNNTQSQDDDWYEYGTTNVPDNINDNLFTDGKVSIGLNTNVATLNVERSLLVSSDDSNAFNTNSSGIVVGDSNTVTFTSPGISVGNNNSISGNPNVVANFGSYNRAVGSADLNGGMLVGNHDTIIYSGWDNEVYVTGYQNYLQSSGSNNTMFLYGKNNRLLGSGNNRFAYTIGKNNILSFSGSNNSAYIVGNDNSINAPTSAYSSIIIGNNDTIIRSNNSVLIGFDNLISSNESYNYLFGESIEVDADHTFAIGKNIFLNNNGVMALSDGNLGSTTLTSTTNYQFISRFQGGYSLFSNATLTSGVTLAAGGGAWANISDKNKKENFQDIDKQEVLNKLSAFKIYNWNYKSQDKAIRHIGPFAQDFYSAFNLGTSEKSIVTSDISGVNMVAIQALDENNKQLKKQVETLQTENEAIKLQLQQLEEKLNLLLDKD